MSRNDLSDGLSATGSYVMVMLLRLNLGVALRVAMPTAHRN